MLYWAGKFLCDLLETRSEVTICRASKTFPPLFSVSLLNNRGPSCIRRRGAGPPGPIWGRCAPQAASGTGSPRSWPAPGIWRV